MGQVTSSDNPIMQGKCVFCGCTDLADTRIWPRWLDQIIPKKAYRRIDGETGEPMDDLPASLQQQRTDLRPAEAQRPRLACASCNDGWITALGEQVRPVLAPALAGTRMDLAAEQAKGLAAWLCLLAMNAVFLSRQCGISAGDRSYLRHTGQPPKNWIIFVAGLSEGGWSNGCKHHPYRIEFAGNPMTTHSRGRPTKECNTQLLSFGMGPLFFHIFSSPSLLLQSEFANSTRSRGLTQLWPLERRFGVLPPRHVTLPPALKLTDEQAWDITDLFADLLQQRLPAAQTDTSRVLGAVA